MLSYGIKYLTRVQVDNTLSLFLIYLAVHLPIEADQVGQARPAFHKPFLALSGALVVLYVLCDDIQDDQHQGQTDRTVVQWILHLALLVPVIWDLLNQSGLLVNDAKVSW
ncbi:hypothetical protein WISP_116665 [Willisornis vidua]|uniref:Uncharacterized protein n=1 Tax=Willisornis vidua TaxID=1566151 RepID=A0ABQ9CTT3_9PASS|nr:hypothetical protein WISP_116665 [Willisornis vidua]